MTRQSSFIIALIFWLLMCNMDYVQFGKFKMMSENNSKFIHEYFFLTTDLNPIRFNMYII